MGAVRRRRDELVGSLKGKPGLRRLLRRTPTGRLRIDRATAACEAHYDGKWLLRTSVPTDLRAHVQLCWLALLLIHAEIRTGDTWRNLRHELDRMHLVTLATADGHRRGHARAICRALLWCCESWVLW
ncbi:hypothetical protein M5I08_20000 [Candidatus Mycobacterium methanotrophicum]|uniref:Transposase n=1 Tax=Candidatus Mycobacterium methanotrophicum TaxID=2943498 RepID=A0ABY4QHN9_9MYCO|nr:hypothetical protein [Candidatus Mycobacterium methanotrophicum]UQX10379.1 hypothetical protein M5I08_20000 [Candidatus Mycobacterium methanotrophicum]